MYPVCMHTCANPFAGYRALLLLRSGRNCRLFDENGVIGRLQRQPIARGRGGSVGWLVLGKSCLISGPVLETSTGPTWANDRSETVCSTTNRLPNGKLSNHASRRLSAWPRQVDASYLFIAAGLAGMIAITSTDPEKRLALVAQPIHILAPPARAGFSFFTQSHCLYLPTFHCDNTYGRRSARRL
ncbi:unnamed protein product [Protopolystoma xenopodis]|uniref:Uncharacterized protein n=1 Tax=Protopolystoma xenopodis TaxID=117903 RepID=A0A448WV36_9PLAT|nr:unnamed protein product [Protopolystoma xenopodis]